MSTGDSRLAHDWWRTWLPLGAVILAVLALVALPVLRVAQVRPFNEEIRTVTEPSRTLLTRIHVALALEQSLLRDFIEGSDSVAVSRYRKAVADERTAYEELAPLILRLGPKVKSEFEQLRELERAWHGEIDKLLSRGLGQRFTRDPMHAKLYEDVLLTVARLDEGLNEAAANRRAAVETTNRAQVWITFAVGIIALSTVLVIAWLGTSLRSFAVNEETGRQRLQEAIDSRQRLVRGITHDLKNPLHTIFGTAEILGEEIPGPLNPDQKNMVRRIEGSARHLVSMVTDLLEMSLAEGGSLSIRPVPTALPELLTQTVEGYTESARTAGLDLKFSIAARPFDIVTDPQRVSQIMQNLLSNALKYTPAGGCVTVSVAMRRVPDSAASIEMVAIDVSDTGGGIPNDQLEHIFDEFARLDSHRNLPGSGLGLAIARRIALLLGGNLTADSSPNGSTFTLWLPRDRRTVSSERRTQLQ
jgi:signal transduction histidine kinase